MKRRDLIRHLEQHGCQLLREGRNHSIYVNRAAAYPQRASSYRDQRRPRSQDLQGSRRSTSVNLTAAATRGGLLVFWLILLAAPAPPAADGYGRDTE